MTPEKQAYGSRKIAETAADAAALGNMPTGFSTGSGGSMSMGQKPPGATGPFALSNTKMHPTLRLDGYLKQTDPSYSPSPKTHGDSFVRRMNTYGGVRPSVAFTSEGRDARGPPDGEGPFMSNLPPLWYDAAGDKREYSFKLPGFNQVDNSFVKMFENYDLMMPSERRKEHEAMKKGIEQWRRARAELFEYKKRKRIIELTHKSGVTSIDGPLFPQTELFSEHRGVLQSQAKASDLHAQGRMGQLAMHTSVDDATAARDYGSPHAPSVRSADIPMQRKCVDPHRHPARFMDTYARLWPAHEPQWDPERAKVLRHHDVRHKKYNIINQSDNTIQGIRVRADPGAAAKEKAEAAEKAKAASI